MTNIKSFIRILTAAGVVLSLAACNQKARFYRVNQSFAQLAEGLAERAVSVHENSVEWLIREMEADSGTQR